MSELDDLKAVRDSLIDLRRKAAAEANRLQGPGVALILAEVDLVIGYQQRVEAVTRLIDQMEAEAARPEPRLIGDFPPFPTARDDDEATA